MRKPRDFDAELQALTDTAKALKAKKQNQLGELVISTGADALSIELLAGVLLEAADTQDSRAKEGWRKRGTDYFRNNSTRTRKGAGVEQCGAASQPASAQPQ